MVKLTKKQNLKLVELFEAGHKLEAIKFIHDEKSMGLRESKEYIDELWDKLKERKEQA